MTLLIWLMLSSYITCFAFRYSTKHKSHFSACDICEQPLSWYEKIPLLSFLLLKGRCRHCQQPINSSFFLAECIGFMIGMVLTYYPQSWQTHLKIAVYLTIFLTDYYHQLIPDRTILLLLLINLNHPLFNIKLILFCLFLLIFVMKQQFGMGDVKLIYVTSLPYSLIEINLVLLISSMLTLLMMLGLQCFKKTTLHQPFPFGCSWVVSCLLVDYLI